MNSEMCVHMAVALAYIGQWPVTVDLGEVDSAGGERGCCNCGGRGIRVRSAWRRTRGRSIKIEFRACQGHDGAIDCVAVARFTTALVDITRRDASLQPDSFW